MSPQKLEVSCAACGTSLGLSSNDLWPDGMFWQRGTRGALSFKETPKSRFQVKEEVKCGPFWETSNSWGISRAITTLQCRRCSARLGMWAADGPPSNHGHAGFGPGQYVHRVTRYCLRKKAIKLLPEGGS